MQWGVFIACEGRKVISKFYFLPKCVLSMFSSFSTRSNTAIYEDGKPIWCVPYTFQIEPKQRLHHGCYMAWPESH
jgi:hypothetical protein